MNGYESVYTRCGLNSGMEIPVVYVQFRGLNIRRNEYAQAIKLIETTAFETEKFLGGYILKSVSEDVSFSALKIPCPKHIYEYLREKFFWLLSERKGYS